MRTVYGFTIATLIAACVPTLPAELDPQSTGAAGSNGSGAGGMSTRDDAGPGRTSGTGGGAGTLVMCDPGCVPMAGCQNQAPETPSPISNFESACTGVDPVAGRDGSWYLYAGGTTTITPTAAEPFRASCMGAAGSCYSACISGTLSGPEWPSVMLGVALRADARAYNMSGYGSVVFSVYGYIGASSELRFKVPLAADTMVGNGDGTCTAGCYDSYMQPLSDFGAQPGVWEKREVNFLALRQAGWGMPVLWDPTTVIALQWEVGSLAQTMAGDDFLVCVDQVGLVPL